MVERATRQKITPLSRLGAQRFGAVFALVVGSGALLPAAALGAKKPSKPSVSSSPSVEQAALQRATKQLRGVRKGKVTARAYGELAAIAELRGKLPPRVILRSLESVARAWGGAVERLGGPGEALRALLCDVALDLEADEHRRWLELPGSVTAWSWLGPLTAGAGTAFGRVVPAENTVAQAGSYTGRDGAVHWQLVPEALGAAPQFSALIERPAAAIVIASTWFYVPVAQRVQLSVTSPGNARLWLDGVKVSEHLPVADAHGFVRRWSAPRVVAVTVRPGWHVARVKLRDSAGRPSVRLRFANGEGEAEGFAHRAEPPAGFQPSGWTRAPAAFGKAAVGKAALGARVQEVAALVAAAGKGDVRAAIALGAMRTHGWPAAQGDDVGAILAKLRAKSPQLWRSWALTAGEAGDVVTRLRQWPARPVAALLVAQAHGLVELDRATAAHRLYGAFAAATGAAADEQSIAACAQRVDLWLQLGADVAALTESRGCRARWPAAPLLLDVHARVMTARDHLRAAAEMHRRLFALHPGSPRRFLELLAAMTIVGPPSASEMGFLRRALDKSGAHRRGWERLAQVQLAAKQADAAVDSLAHLAPWQWRSTTWALAARVAAARGETTAAVKSLRAALRAAPGRDDYRARLRRLAPADRFFAPYERDLVALARAHKAGSTPIENLFTQTVIRHDGGRQARMDAEVIAIGVGGPTEHTVSIDVVPSQSTAEVLLAGVVKADGRLVRSVDRKLERLSEDWYGLYYDLEQVQLRFSELEPGDHIVVQYVVRDFAADPFGMVFGELMLLGDTHPMREIDIVIELPAGTALHHVAWDPRTRSRLPQQLVSRPVRADRGRRFSTWRLRGGPTAGVKIDAAMPGATEVVPYLHASSFANAEAVGKWYAHLVQQALRGAAADPALRALAARLRGKSTAETVANVFRYASDEIRYVGLEFGIHSLLPHDAQEVVARKFGDCKDKATLITALLQLNGVDAQVALVRTASNGRLSDPVASLGVFDHAIAWVPAERLWLDATQQHHTTTELPQMDAGGMALRVPLQPAHPPAALLLLSQAEAAANHRVERRNVELDADHRAKFDVAIALAGLPAAAARRRLHAVATRVEKLETSLSAELPGAHVTDVRATGISPPAAVKLAYRAAAAQVSSREPTVANSPEVRTFRPFPAGKSLLERFGGEASRHHELLLPYAFVDEHYVTVTAPPGYVVASLPAAAAHDDENLQFSSSCTPGTSKPSTSKPGNAKPGVVVVCSARLVAKRHRVPLSDVPQWRAALARADRALARVVRFRAETASSAAGGAP